MSSILGNFGKEIQHSSQAGFPAGSKLTAPWFDTALREAGLLDSAARVATVKIDNLSGHEDTSAGGYTGNTLLQAELEYVGTAGTLSQLDHLPHSVVVKLFDLSELVGKSGRLRDRGAAIFNRTTKLHPVHLSWYYRFNS
jgi:hypothetical protein